MTRIGVGADKSQQLLLPGMACESFVRANRVISKARLPTNTTTRFHGLHRWFNFIAGFSPEFVHQCCEAAGLGSADILLDPFAGCATAPLVACERGMRAVGYEPHPVFLRIARAKLLPGDDLGRLDAIETALRKGLCSPLSAAILPPDPRRFLE